MPSMTGLLNIYCNDPVNPIVQVSLKGQGLLSGARIGLSASSHNFGSVWVGEGITYWDFKFLIWAINPWMYRICNCLSLNFHLMLLQFPFKFYLPIPLI